MTPAHTRANACQLTWLYLVFNSVGNQTLKQTNKRIARRRYITERSESKEDEELYFSALE